jgi:hypothetical protein
MKSSYVNLDVAVRGTQATQKSGVMTSLKSNSTFLPHFDKTALSKMIPLPRKAFVHW